MYEAEYVHFSDLTLKSNISCSYIHSRTTEVFKMYLYWVTGSTSLLFELNVPNI